MKIWKTKKNLTLSDREDPVSEKFVRVLDEVGFAADQLQMINGRSYLPLPARFDMKTVKTERPTFRFEPIDPKLDRKKLDEGLDRLARRTLERINS
ncbi:MAG: hypothetical protein AAB740_01365 [Patescibacteria group bacterium]